jgi:hypothetical protein
MSVKKYLEWENVNIRWDILNMLWEEVFILIEVGSVIKRTGGYANYVKGNPWDKTSKILGEEKTNKFIKIVCLINDLKFEDVIYPNPNVKIETHHIEKVFNESIKIGIKFE